MRFETTEGTPVSSHHGVEVNLDSNPRIGVADTEDCMPKVTSQAEVYDEKVTARDLFCFLQTTQAYKYSEFLSDLCDPEI